MQVCKYYIAEKRQKDFHGIIFFEFHTIQLFRIYMCTHMKASFRSRINLLRSMSKSCFKPGLWIFTATFSPLRSTALWTWRGTEQYHTLVCSKATLIQQNLLNNRKTKAQGNNPYSTQHNFLEQKETFFGSRGFHDCFEIHFPASWLNKDNENEKKATLYTHDGPTCRHFIDGL